jgi:hypothetical protein
MKISETKEYMDAWRSLESLKAQHGATSEVRAIAKLLLYASECEAQAKPFPWVGVAGNALDESYIEAQEQRWRLFLNGDDEDD